MGIHVAVYAARKIQPIRSLEGKPDIAIKPVAFFFEVAFIGRPIGIVDEPCGLRCGRVLVSRTVPCPRCAIRPFVVCKSLVVDLYPAPLEGFEDDVAVRGTRPRPAG